MRKTGITNLPLHGGQAPSWLFSRMVKLSAAMSQVIIEEFGTEELIKKVSDPNWFQSFGCVLGFDWHSSGLTTTVCGALKEGFKKLSPNYGLYVCGGKGKTSRKTPEEITLHAEKIGFDPKPLIYASKMTAKTDSAAIQDGYQLYHHTFIFDKAGHWSVVQQGMNEENRYARRYHWLNLEPKFIFLDNPHTGIIGRKEAKVLDMTSDKSDANRNLSVELANTHPDKLANELTKIQALNLPAHHDIKTINPKHFRKIAISTYENKPQNFEELLSLPGVGPKNDSFAFANFRADLWRETFL